MEPVDAMRLLGEELVLDGIPLRATFGAFRMGRLGGRSGTHALSADPGFARRIGLSFFPASNGPCVPRRPGASPPASTRRVQRTDRDGHAPGSCHSRAVNAG